ncbi:WSC-domain-containing protein [Thozetella sp. PMI_491]|nr:WSC-domain-containing protein [Thozetella sp. PMI_491]
MGASSLLATAVAAVAIIGRVQATEYILPPCTSPFQPFVYSGCFSNPGNPNALSWQTDLSFNSVTVESCVAECKGNGYRYAGVIYGGYCFCGQTVVGGSLLDDKQCNIPCTGNSSETCGGENKISIYQDPTFPKPSDSTTISDYVSLGCWTDGGNYGKALNIGMSSPSGDAVTTESCLQACKNGGYPFAGTEYGGECYCGVVIGNNTKSAPATDCDKPCRGNTSQICGGGNRMNLYVAEDLESIEPCGYVPPVISSSSTTSTLCSTTSSSTSTTSSTSTSTTAATTTSAAVCTTTTVIPPSCEYKCGDWCSSPLPDWNDQNSCKSGHSSCAIQVSACFKTAGWPDAMSCFDFSGWCDDVKDYCKGSGSRSKSDCIKRNPPKGGNSKPVTSTITIPCKTTSTPTPSSTSTKCPIPTPTGICTQPSNRQWGYGPGNPVGGIDLAVVTCNDLKDDFYQNPFKLYTESDSSKCSSYSRNKVPSACASACKAQYDQCSATYVKGCQENHLFGRRDTSYFEYAASGETKKRTFGWSDSYKTAGNKCQAQYSDCLSVNKDVSGSGKCGSWGNGW